MQQRTSINAFTLVEILVAIAIISILVFSISQMSFNRLSQKQKLSISSEKLITQISTARDNALIGRSVLSGSTLISPAGWEVRLSNDTSSGALAGSYSIIGDFSDQITANDLEWNYEIPFEIRNIECLRIDESISQSDISWVSIRFFGSSRMELRCENTTLDPREKILRITYGVGSPSEIIEVNTLSGIIEKKSN